MPAVSIYNMALAPRPPSPVPKTASGWLRQLPALDVIGRQQHVTRVFDGMRQYRREAARSATSAGPRRGGWNCTSSTCAPQSWGVERVTVSLSTAGANATLWMIEQEYLYVLPIHQLNTGNLSPAELDRASAQLRDGAANSRSTPSRGRRKDSSSTSPARAGSCAGPAPTRGRCCAIRTRRRWPSGSSARFTRSGRAGRDLAQRRASRGVDDREAPVARSDVPAVDEVPGRIAKYGCALVPVIPGGRLGHLEPLDRWTTSRGDGLTIVREVAPGPAAAFAPAIR